MTVDRDPRPRDGRRRPTPLLLAAAVALILMLGLGVAVVATRTNGANAGHQDGEELLPPLDPGVEPVATVDATVRPGDGGAEPPPSSPASRSLSSSVPGHEPLDGSVDELPIWARPPPPSFTTPYPDGAAYNPPLPPIKIPAWMLTDAGPAGFPGVNDGGAPGPGATSLVGS